MKMGDKEFASFCLELIRSGRRHGIDADMMSTIIAEAIKNREKVVYKSEKPQVQTIEQKERQLLYGPPPVIEEQVIESIQPLYGPPPVREWETVEVSKKK